MSDIQRQMSPVDNMFTPGGDCCVAQLGDGNTRGRIAARWKDIGYPDNHTGPFEHPGSYDTPALLGRNRPTLTTRESIAFSHFREEIGQTQTPSLTVGQHPLAPTHVKIRRYKYSDVYGIYP